MWRDKRQYQPCTWRYTIIDSEITLETHKLFSGHQKSILLIIFINFNKNILYLHSLIIIFCQLFFWLFILLHNHVLNKSELNLINSLYVAENANWSRICSSELVMMMCCRQTVRCSDQHQCTAPVAPVVSASLQPAPPVHQYSGSGPRTSQDHNQSSSTLSLDELLKNY